MKRRRLAGWSSAGALALLAMAWVLGAGVRYPAGDASGYGDGPATAAVSRPAPPLRGTTLAGGAFDLAEQRGHVVLVNVWASWCAPCRDELPALAAAQRRWAGQGLLVAGIDMRDNAESALRLLDELHVTGLTSVADPQGTTAVAWGARGVPETFVVDRGGTVRVWAQGGVDDGWLDRYVAPLLRS